MQIFRKRTGGSAQTRLLFKCDCGWSWESSLDAQGRLGNQDLINWHMTHSQEESI
jgi:hypothetical protein